MIENVLGGHMMGEKRHVNANFVEDPYEDKVRSRYMLIHVCTVTPVFDAEFARRAVQAIGETRKRLGKKARGVLMVC